VIYQAPLSGGGFRGMADFLVKTTDGYEVWDAKLSKSPKPQHGVQLCCYADMLSQMQHTKVSPRACLVLNGASQITPLDVHSYQAYYRNIKQRYNDPLFLSLSLLIFFSGSSGWFQLGWSAQYYVMIPNTLPQFILPSTPPPPP
jgi:hypothetical protein